MNKRWAVLGGLGLGAVIWGLVSEAQGALEGSVEDDDTLAERVRARLARAVAHPETVQVSVEDGVVTLAGSVAAVEFDRLVSGVLRVRGVKDVNDQLDVRPTPNGARDFEDIPAD
jgi:osmotically-inducible protein OsmY